MPASTGVAKTPVRSESERRWQGWLVFRPARTIDRPRHYEVEV